MEHVNLINRIIEAEQKAQEIEKEARDKLAALPADLLAQKNAMRDSFFERAHRRVNTVREREEAHTRQTLDMLSKKRVEEINRLEELFAANREQWTDSLFNMLVGT